LAQGFVTSDTASRDLSHLPLGVPKAVKFYRTVWTGTVTLSWHWDSRFFRAPNDGQIARPAGEPSAFSTNLRPPIRGTGSPRWPRTWRSKGSHWR
jgi:hypothetical protein